MSSLRARPIVSVVARSFVLVLIATVLILVLLPAAAGAVGILATRIA